MNDIPDDIDGKQAALAIAAPTTKLPARLSIAARETGLTLARADSLVAVFQPHADRAMECILAADGVKDGDVEGAKRARGDLKKVRCAVENLRKAEKADSLKLGRAIDTLAAVITKVVEPVESRMEEIEKAEERAAQRAKIERANRRREELAAIGGVAPDAYLVMEMTDQAWAAYVAGEKTLKAEREAASAKYAAEVAAAQAAQKAEAERLRVENERLAKAAQEALEARRAVEEAARKEREALEAKAALELAEAQEAANRERLEREKLAKEIVERSEAEHRKAEAERKAKVKAARAPDRVKLLALADKVAALEYPTMATDDGEEVLVAFRNILNSAVNSLKSCAEAL